MSDSFILLLPLALFAVRGWQAWSSIRMNRRLLKGWEEDVKAKGLQVMETTTWGLASPRLVARMGPVAVTIGGFGSKERRIRIDVRLPGPPDFYNVNIRREPLIRRAGEIEIGDKSFDSTFFIEGPTRLVLSLLDAETRGLLTKANIQGRLQIATGILRTEDVPDEWVPHVLSLLLEVGQRWFGQPADVVRRLADNARNDPEAGVRLQNLLLLIRELPAAPETLEALRAAVSDPSPEVRLQAAKGLGAEGRGILLDLAESLVDDTVSAEAVSALDRELPFDRTKAILGHALDKGLLKTARACLQALGQSEDAAAAEPSLIPALQREQADLRVAAANALARVGSAAAVLPLQEAAERFWRDLELRRSARQAIAEIQSRLQGASPGQLSLETAQGGQVSLTQAEIGQVSLAADPAGQLSMLHAESAPHALPPEQPEPSSPIARKEPDVRRG